MSLSNLTPTEWRAWRDRMAAFRQTPKGPAALAHLEDASAIEHGADERVRQERERANELAELRRRIGAAEQRERSRLARVRGKGSSTPSETKGQHGGARKGAGRPRGS
jgi:hypothetical protein